MQLSKTHSSISGRDVQKFHESLGDFKTSDFSTLGEVSKSLRKIGIVFDEKYLNSASTFAMDDQQGLNTVASNAVPIQFLQNWLPGMVHNITAARKIDEILGITAAGDWADEQVVQTMLELVGNAIPYGDYTNVPLSSWNVNFAARTIVRMEKGFKVGRLESERASKIRLDTANEKRNAAAIALDIERNLIGFNGFNNGSNQTYGFLNDPALPAYVTVPNGASASPLWSQKTFAEISADIQTGMAQLQNQSQDNINPETVATTIVVPTAVYQYLNTPTVLNGYSPRDYIANNYPLARVVSAPQLNAANGGANVFYIFADRFADASTDGGQTFIQPVPAKFLALGIKPEGKAFVEDFSNATAGVMLKRPWAVVRYSGI